MGLWDASRKILPWGILIGGEELHNNHHAYSRSARLSSRWWEFDLGWAYIRLLAALHLARVIRVAPRLRFSPGKTRCDSRTVQAVMTHRWEVLSRYARSLRRTALTEIRELRARATPGLPEARAVIRHWLQRDAGDLAPAEQMVLEQALHSSPVLRTIHAMRQELTDLWNRSTASKEQLVRQLEDWCQRAEASGIQALGEFSRQLRCYG